MAWTYEHTLFRRISNWFITRALRLGVPMGSNYLLTVAGRKTGEPRTTPITLAERAGERYLVAPYGVVDWVRNARKAGKVTLSRGRHYEITPVTELPPDQAAPVLKQYVNEVPIVRPFFDAAADSSLDHFEAEAPRKAVFRLG